MATTSPDASEIRRRGRQRLIGAVAIALLLIVFVPMLLDSEPRKAREEPRLDIPARENAPPLPAPPAAAPAPAPQPPVAEVKPVPVPAPEAAKKPAPPPPKVAVVEPKGPAKAEGFVVQVGAFADDGRLQEIKGKLALSNIVTYTEAAGSLKRLRVGPFPTRDAAEKSAVEVRKIVPDAKVVSAH